MAVTPQNLRCAVQTMPLNPFSDVGPAGLTAATDIAFLIVPPKLKAAEGIVFVVSDTQNTIGIQ